MARQKERAAVRKARVRKRTAQEEIAHAIASRVYSVALDIAEGATYPLALQAPVQSAAEIAAARIVAERWPEAEGDWAEELVGGLVTYLLAGFFSMALEYDPEHHARFRAAVSGRGGDGGADDGGGEDRSEDGGAGAGEPDPFGEGGDEAGVEAGGDVGR